MPIAEVPDIPIPEIGEQHKITAIKKPHEDWARLAAKYEWLSDSYTGKGGYETYTDGFDANGGRRGNLPEKTYLQKYHSEPQEKWERRLAAAYYPNLIRRIVSIYAGLLTRENPTPDNYPPEIESWQGEGDAGWNLKRAQMIPWELVYPIVYILTDAPKQDPDVVTAAQAGESEPYASLIHPQRALDWEYDKDGALIYFKYTCDISRRAIVEGLPEREVGVRYTVFTTQGWWYYEIWKGDKSGTAPVLDAGEWPDSVQGTLPVAVYHSGLTGDCEEDISPIEYLCRVMLRLHNVNSQKASTEDGSCFPVPLIPTRGDGDVQKMTWGEGTGITFPHDSTNKPHFMGYDVAPVEHMTNESQRLDALIRDLASLSFGGDDAGDTGIAKAYAFMLTDVTLATLVLAIEDVELQVMNLIAKWLGNADGLPDGAQPGFPRTFDLVGTREEIDNAVKLLEMEMGPIARTEITKRSVYKYLTDTDPDTLIAIEDEFDDMAEGKGEFADDTQEEDEALEAARAAEAQALEAPDIEPR